MKPRARVCSEDKTQAALNALADDIDYQPDIIRPVEKELVDRIRSLVAGIEVDLDQPLSPELDDAGTRAFPELGAWLLQPTALSWGHLPWRRKCTTP